MTGPDNADRETLLLPALPQPSFTSQFLLRIIPPWVAQRGIFGQGQFASWLGIHGRRANEKVLAHAAVEEFIIELHVGDFKTEEIYHHMRLDLLEGNPHGGQIFAIRHNGAVLGWNFAP